MTKLRQHQSVHDFQRLISDIYSMPDDRLFSLDDLLMNMQRFTMRTLKGIRKNNNNRIRLNLMIAFAWHMAICNRLHIDIEEALWYRFPRICSYCGNRPCSCRKEKVVKRVKISRKGAERPNRIGDYQAMFEQIYPSSERTLADAGVHLAEETGEVSEAAHNYFGQHKLALFEELILELADWISCMYGVANSAKIDVAGELEKLFADGCHVCHKTPCICSFKFIANYKA